MAQRTIVIKHFFLVLVLFFDFGCQGHKAPPWVRLPPVRHLSAQDRVLKLRESVRIAEREKNYLHVLAGGDVMVGHWTLDFLQQEGADYPFRRLKPVLGNAEIVFANLEAPFADSGRAVEKRFTFKVPTRFATGIKQAGINLLSIANNHILDYGMSGLEQTVAALNQAGLHFAGAGMSLEQAWQPAVLSTPAGTVAMLAFSMTFPREFWATDSTGGTAYPYEQKLVQTLDSLRRNVDFVIVSFHWGTEKMQTPKDYQVYFAHLAIDHGADLVLGHHPHVLQGIEIYRNRLIAYSLGNFAFSSFSRTATQSMLLKVVLHRHGLLFAKIYPLNIDNTMVQFQPRLANEEGKKQIIAHIDSLSYALNAYDIVDDDGLILGSFPGAAEAADRPWVQEKY
ncbi:MAG: CapA family protein [Calditrichaeota bacterium]|nr:MAG: CapA family protein [Calditrichota bacterium]